jgi:hypothetical protein
VCLCADVIVDVAQLRECLLEPIQQLLIGGVVVDVAARDLS